MMKRALLFVIALLFLGSTGISMGSSGYAGAQVIQWSVEPPNYYNDVGRRAFQGGLEAAHHDWDLHRDMNPYRYPQYRHPPVAGPGRDRYRDAFLQGYDQGTHRGRGWDQDRNNYWRDDIR